MKTSALTCIFILWNWWNRCCMLFCDIPENREAAC